MERKTNILGIDLVYDVPSTLAENVTLCGGEDKANAIIINQVLAHGTFTGLRDDFLHCKKVEEDKTSFDGVEVATKIPRLSKEFGPKKTKEWGEKESAYFERVCAMTGKVPADFASIMELAVAANPYDPSTPERQPRKPAEPSREDKAIAAALFAKSADELAGVVAMLAAELNHPVESTLEGLGLAIRESRLAEQARVVAAQRAKYGVAPDAA